MGKHILFVGGGTAGHISPLLAVMEEAQKKGAQCSYVGTASDIASQLIQESVLKFDRYSIQAGKLNRFLTLKQLIQPFRLSVGFLQSYALLRRIKPDIIFSKGGFVSVPVVLAAHQLHIPVISHETDVIPGLANQIISRSARTICTTFPIDTYTKLPGEKLVYTGQPVRAVFYSHQPLLTQIQGRERQVTLPLITVIGGSQGAHRLNELVQALWPEILQGSQLVHICGTNDFHMLNEKAKALPHHLQKNLWLAPFLSKEIPSIFQQSTLVISRAGGTISELAACHSPVLLVPLHTSSQGHQAANAAVLEKVGAAAVFDETGTAAAFGVLVESLIKNEHQRSLLQKNIATFSIPDSAEKIANLLLE